MKVTFTKICVTAFGALTILWVLSCLTINVYFPAAAVQDAANQFVSDVQSQATPAAPSPSAGENNRSYNFELISTAQAQSNDTIAINTPVAKQLKDEMKTYQAEVGALKDKGLIGESAKGLLVDRDLKSLGLKERSDANRLLATANGHRMKLYLEVIRANQYPDSKLDEVQRIFSRSWQSLAKAGWWIQKEDGSWVKK